MDLPTDSMQDRIEEKLRDLLLGSNALADLKVVYRGEPGAVPTKWYPFGVVFLDTKHEATGEEGYGESTGMRFYRYDGHLAFEDVFKDATRMVPGTDRKADVESYVRVKTLCEAAFNAILEWGGPTGALEEDPVVSEDGKEATVELRTDNQRNGAADRGLANANNRSTFEFHIYTRRTDW